jgi:REP element-mobilizing transposase RayT
VRHRARAVHRKHVPTHVTLRRAKGLPSLRAERMFRVVREAIRDTQRDGFRIVHFSVQADHVHMIIEADDAALLTKGMRSFAIRVALRVNRQVFDRRHGKVWGDRYHRHDLASPSAVRNALVYVLSNHLKHGEYDVGLIDPLSSGPGFKGWMRDIPPLRDPTPAVPAVTWLLDEGWTTVSPGYLNPGEVPRALRR